MLSLMVWGLVLFVATRSLPPPSSPAKLEQNSKYKIVTKVSSLQGMLDHTIESDDPSFFTGRNLRSKYPTATFCHPDTKKELKDGERLEFSSDHHTIVLPIKVIKVVDISFGTKTNITTCPADDKVEILAKYGRHQRTLMPFVLCENGKIEDKEVCVKTRDSCTVKIPWLDGKLVTVAHSVPLFTNSIRHVAASLLQTPDKLVALCADETGCEWKESFISEKAQFKRPNYVVIDTDPTIKIPVCPSSTLPYCKEFKRGYIKNTLGCDPLLLKRIVLLHPTLSKRHFKLDYLDSNLSGFLNAEDEDYQVTPIPIELLDVKHHKKSSKQNDNDYKTKYKKQLSILRGSIAFIAIFVAINAVLFIWTFVKFSTDNQ